MESSSTSTRGGQSFSNSSPPDVSVASSLNDLDLSEKAAGSLSDQSPQDMGSQQTKIPLPSDHEILLTATDDLNMNAKPGKEKLQQVQVIEDAIMESLGEDECDEGDSASCKRRFVDSLMAPCTRPGYLTCRLCNSNVWGPNGRYHIDTCPVLLYWRFQQSERKILSSVNGIQIYHKFFTKPKPLMMKTAKIPGFAMSHTVLRSDPRKAPTLAQKRKGGFTGRKGYTRCLYCNEEIFAPNTRRHISVCRKWDHS